MKLCLLAGSICGKWERQPAPRTSDCEAEGNDVMRGSRFKPLPLVPTLRQGTHRIEWQGLPSPFIVLLCDFWNSFSPLPSLPPSHTPTFCAVLGIEPGIWCVLGKCCSIKLCFPLTWRYFWLPFVLLKDDIRCKYTSALYVFMFKNVMRNSQMNINIWIILSYWNVAHVTQSLSFFVYFCIVFWGVGSHSPESMEDHELWFFSLHLWGAVMTGMDYHA